MNADRWQQIKPILYSALELHPSQRESFLDRECGQDSELRDQMESLIAAQDRSEDVMESPAVELMADVMMNDGPIHMLGKTFGHYTILEQIGNGGMGDVYLAKDTQLDRKVAIKILPASFAADAQARQRFIQEAKAASSLNNPHIITIYEIATTDTDSYIVMEYVEGSTFRKLLSRGAIEMKKAADHVAQVASGLAAAHEAGIVHRDIKPENLMLTKSGQVKILDFGLAKLIEKRHLSIRDSSQSTLDIRRAQGKVETLPGTIMGTVAYMSPEQAEGLEIDRRTDIFSLGVVLYEMVTGERPFGGKSAIDTLHSIINNEPRPAVDLNVKLPLEIQELIAKALAKDPNERYQHAGDLEIDLNRFKRALESGTLLSTRLRSDEGRSNRSLAPKYLFGTGLILVTAMLGWLFWPDRSVTSAAAYGIQLERTTLAPLTVDPGFEGEPTFAPDGQTIAYVSDRTGNFEIFLRQVAGGPDINLTNEPADDMQPSISPDGKQIAFISARTGESDCLCFFVYGTDQPLMGGSIWVMPTFGGSPRKIVENGTFPSWTPDGSSIIFTQGPWFGQKIFKVPANGGEPLEIPVELAKPAPFIAYPTYSSDGNSIVFEAGNTVYAVNAQGGKPVEVVEGKHPVWTADSKSIIYTNVDAGKNYTLWQVPFSAKDSKAEGSPSPLTVGRGRDTQAAVSRDGKLIAFSALDVSFNLESTPFDAESAKVSLSPKPVTSGSDLIYFFSTTEDGGSATFDSHRGSSSFIWRVDQDKPSVQLTGDPAYEDFYPRLSRDGKTIAFNRSLVGETTDPGELWLMEADGGNPRPAVKAAGFVGWLKDGRSLVYTSFADGQLYLYELRSGAARKLSDEEGIFGGGIMSPDEKWVAYMSIAAGNIDIRATPMTGGESISVVETPRQDFHPLFSPSGRWLYFQLDHKNLYRVPGPAQNWKKSPPEKVTKFAESGLFLEDPQISLDGRKLMYSRRKTSGDIWLMRINN